MSLLDGVRHRLHVFWRGEEYAREQEREIGFHLELESLAQERERPDRREAELAARRQFGNVAYYREEMREMTSLAWLDRFEQNLTYAVRGLRRSPGFALSVVITIGLGLGLNATMFSLLDRIMVRQPAGVVAPGDLRRLYIDPGYAVTNRGSRVFGSFSYSNFIGVRRAMTGANVAAYTPQDSMRVDGELGAVAHVSYVSSNFFSVLGVRPVVGRFFGKDEDPIETPTPVLVIGEGLWRGAFGADPKILGRRVRLGEDQFTIVGVAPSNFSGVDLDAADVWAPANSLVAPSNGGRPWYANGGGNYFRAIARLQLGARETELDSRASAAIRALDTEARGRADTVSQVLMGSIVEARGPAEQSSELSISTRIAGVAAIVLIIAFANVTNLLLVRASRRRHEIAVRRALGVSRARLYEQMLTESLLLAGLGGLAALAFAAWGGIVIRTLMFPSVNWVGGAVDYRLLAGVALGVLIAGTIGGVAPAITASQPELARALRAGSGEGGYRRPRLGAILIVAQAALCLVLLVGAGLFLRSLTNVQSIKTGFAMREILVVTLPSSPGHAWGKESQASLADAARALRTVPGVASAALASTAPMAGYSVSRLFRPGTDSMLRIGDKFPAFTSVSPEYFATAGIGLLLGRSFDGGDRVGASPVMIVSQKMAQAVWPGRSPLGQCLVMGKPGEACVTIVGVVEDTHRTQIVEDAGLQYYVPIEQQSGTLGAPVLLVRAAPARHGLVAEQIRSQIARNVAGAQRVRLRTMVQMLDPQLRPWRLGAELFTMFGLLALIVASIGIYSVVSYAVSQRTHEMGVRIALGARARDILDLIVSEGMRVVGVGIACGIATALLLGRFVASLLFGVTANDPSVLIGAASGLCAVAMLASAIPAWRAARVDPASALRAD